MLELRPSCEHCRKALPADHSGATICSYECTFCLACAQEVLAWVCPNCGGALTPRPPRPTDQLAKRPARTEAVHKPVDVGQHPARVAHRLASAGHRPHLWELVVDCADPALLATFYGRLLGVDPEVRSEDWAFVDPHNRGPMLVHGGDPPRGVRVAFQKVPEPKHGKVRIHLDIGVWDIDGAVADALTLGGIQLGERRKDSSGTFVVMADPEGNEFCFVDA